MSSVFEFIAVCDTAISASQKVGLVMRWLQNHWPLSAAEKRLLIAAGDQGVLQVFERESTLSILAGAINFRTGESPAFAAEYLAAFRSLCGRGMIDGAGDGIYQLSASGWKAAHKCKRKVRN